MNSRPKNAVALGEPRAADWTRGITIDDAVVELRDVFPTMLDAAGRLNGPASVVPADYKMDGDSLLCLLGGDTHTDRDQGQGQEQGRAGNGCRGGAWRPWLDLEHFKVYNDTVTRPAA